MFDELPRVMYQEKISSLLPFYSMHKIKSNTNTSKIYLLNICTTYVPTYYSRFRSYVFAENGVMLFYGQTEYERKICILL